MLVAADVYRPAAIKQLQVVGKQIDIPVFADETPGANPVDIARRAVEQSTHMLKDVVIIDTAGRLAIDEVPQWTSCPTLKLLFDLMKFYSL